MPSLDDAGAHVPWRVRENTQWTKVINISRAGVPVNITGDTFDAKVVNSETDLVTVLDLVPTITNAVNGEVTINRSDAQTGPVLPGTYWWYWDWNETVGFTIPLMSGPFIVDPWVP